MNDVALAVADHTWVFGALSRFDSICYSEFASSAAEIKLTTFLSGLGSRSFRLIKRMVGHVLSALARFSHFVFTPVVLGAQCSIRHPDLVE